jgi:alpha-ketoglutarate-dependent taurine dioxygenase
MSAAHALPTGLGIENEGLELPLEELPQWEESKIKTFPLVSPPQQSMLNLLQTWKNPVTGKLHLQCHPCGAHHLLIAPSQGAALYPDGAHLTDLKQVRELLYKMQRPGIAPELVYPVDWEEGDFVLFHNRGLLHSVVGAFEPDQIRMFHQVSRLVFQ